MRRRRFPLSEIRGLSERVLAQIVEQTRDHAQTLADLATRVEPTADELAEAWSRATRAALEGRDAAVVSAAASLRAWFEPLQRREAAGYFSHVAAWARDLADGDLSYDRALTLLREYQRLAIPLLMRVYPAGPELETALGAFDDLFDASTVVVGAAYIDVLQARALVDSRAQVLGQLFGGATHALNNLLAVVLGRMTVLIERTHAAEARDELLDIQQTAALGAQMVQRLQEFTRGDRAEPPRAIDVNLLLRDAAELTRFVWRDQAETAGVVIDVVKDFAEVPPVLARPAALREVFVIMIVEAVRALARGGSITLRTERVENRVLASVTPRGDAETRRARSTTPSAGIPGLPHAGIALDAAANLAREFDATLTMESAAGGGTASALALPLAQISGGEKEKAVMATLPANLLFIDNEAAVRDAFNRLLALHGHHVTTAESGEKGIAAFKASPFDVVFTDLGMPGMSGWDVAREIKKINPAALVVLVTGWPIDLNQQKSKETGVDRVVTKPLDMPLVLGLIDDAVALRGRG